MKTFVEYNKPDGKWGWFYFYNPTSDAFAYKTTFSDDNITIDNWWVWTYQKIALGFLFGGNIKNFNKKIYLDELNDKISYWKKFVEQNKELSSAGSFDADPFPCVLYMISSKNTHLSKYDVPKKEIAAITILLFIDIIIRDCKCLYVENIVFVCHRLENLLKIVYPDFDFEKRQFIEHGKKKGAKNREKFLNDFSSLGLAIFDDEFKYDARISVIMTKYKVGETTAKKYYSLIKDKL
ncbi:MAG: hypothetical protein PHE89_04820 [Alphaproteobacteria bacterium]|nr:hypothetical protein [Alphaproteobacteria bacterium]